MITELLTAIADRLAATEPNLKYIDEDWGQLDYYQESPPVKFPACLLEYRQTSWNNQGRYVQDGIINLSIRVADLPLSGTGLRGSAAQKEKAQALWVILGNIYTALSNWRPANSIYGPLGRVSTQRIKRDDGIREFEMVFTCAVTDHTAQTQYYNIADPAVAAAQFNTVPPAQVLGIELEQA